jgi:glucosylceramidase
MIIGSNNPTPKPGALPQLWQTTPDRLHLLSPISSRTNYSPKTAQTKIALDTHKTGQVMDGFGAALTDSSAWIIAHLPDDSRESLLHDLFDTQCGIGLSVLRLPIGASDFAVNGSYTFHDLKPGEYDPELRRFSINHDRGYILPLLRRIRQINPALKILASPWSAPAWMKTNRSLNAGWLDWSAYPAYARYLIKFLHAYGSEGVPIWALTVQNEPRNANNGYPTMRMEPRDQARFIRDHLGPGLRKAQLKTKIFIWDHNWDMPEYPLEVLADEHARRHIHGVAWHGYGGKPVAQHKIQLSFPNLEVHFTESSGGDWETDFGSNLRWDIVNLLTGATRFGARSIFKWNLALDEQHGPQNGGCTNCRGVVTIHSRTAEITRNEEYYMLGHASKFVKPGAKYLISPERPELAHAAFHNPDGSVVWLGYNSRSTCQSVELQVGDQKVAFDIPPGAVVTLRW